MSKNERLMELDLNLIVFDEELKVRIETDETTAKEYYDAMETEEDVKKFPPPTVYFDGCRYWLADGHHRYLAVSWRGFKKMVVRVIDGSHDEAILAAVKLNMSHGLRFKEGDWERIVTLVAGKKQWASWTNRRLAEELNCGETTIRRYRPEHSVASGGATEKRRGKDGKMYKAKKTKKEQAVATEPKQKESIVTESEQSIVEVPSPHVAEATVPETGIAEDAPSTDQRLVNLNVKQTQIEATISTLEIQLIEWLEIAQPDEGVDFKKEVGERLRALANEF